MSLSDTAGRNARPRQKPYKLGDGKGMYLLVKWSGSKLWCLLKPLADGSVALGLFNRTAQIVSVEVRSGDAGFETIASVRDLWEQAALAAGTSSVEVQPHGVRLLRESAR